MIRRYNEIMDSAIANMVAGQDKLTDFNEGSIIHTFLDTVSRLVERAYVAIRQGYNEQLEMLPQSIFGFEKKNGSFASGVVTFSRQNTLQQKSIIPKGTVISGGGLNFITTENGFIAEGTLDSDEINVIAEKSGKAYNIQENKIDSIESVLSSDIVQVRNEKVFTGGSDEETSDEYRERFKIFINGLSGTNDYAIKKACLDIEQVRSVAIKNHKPLLNDIYNMSIFIDDGSGGATEELLSKVKTVIEGDGSKENPGHICPGINVRVVPALLVYVDVDCVVKVVNADVVTIQNEIIENINSFINSKVIGEAFLTSELVAKIMSINYVVDCKINKPLANVVVDINQIIRLGKLNVSIEVE